MGNMFPKYYNFLIKSLGYNYEKACIELNKIQALSKDELKFWQKKKKWEIARFHFDNNEFYKKIVGPFFPDAWEDLPILKKEDLQSYNLSYSLNDKNKKGYTLPRHQVHQVTHLLLLKIKMLMLWI